jgi:putative FmdB family regulatory protein
MPTYEYACSNCGNVWEEVQRITADASDTCPKCGQKTAKRQINGGNFILKGGGWYADLYSSSKPGSGSGSGASGSSGSGTSGSSSGGESKSEASAPAPTTTSSDSGSSSSSGGTSGGSSGSSST